MAACELHRGQVGGAFVICVAKHSQPCYSFLDLLAKCARMLSPSQCKYGHLLSGPARRAGNKVAHSPRATLPSCPKPAYVLLLCGAAG
eukprot:6211839-Pleurochrysis_carterae.AAC.2